MLLRLGDRIQTLWRKGTVQRFNLNQYVDHSFNAALLIGLTVRFGDGLRRWAKEQAVPFPP
jgi:hypothetical protein